MLISKIFKAQKTNNYTILIYFYVALKIINLKTQINKINSGNNISKVNKKKSSE